MLGALPLLAAGGWYLAKGVPTLPAGFAPAPRAPDSRAAFDEWLAAEPGRAADIRALDAFLVAEGVAGIVPAWQLARVDADYAQRCDVGYFALPPREKWENIVPALRLVRAHVIPAVGPVELLSSFRSTEVNACVRGASASKHLGFHALDLRLAEGVADGGGDAAVFAALCQMQRDAGQASKMGLGAYFRPDEPHTSRGRFHIDAEGYRTWGFDYSMASNPCPQLLG